MTKKMPENMFDIIHNELVLPQVEFHKIKKLKKFLEFIIIPSIICFLFLGVKACSYPGTVISGRMSTVKFYYQIGESVAFTCDSGLNMMGASMLRCLKTGKWSAAIPTCVAP